MKKLRFLRLLLIAAFVALVLAAVGCGSTEAPKSAASTAPAASPEKKPVLAEKPGEWKPDGVIADNEYSKMQVFGELEVYSRIDGDKVRIALKAKTEGYVAIGFDPSDRMKDADIIIGAVKDGKATVVDMFSTGPTGPHPPDDQQGGRNDVTVFGGAKANGVTVIEFERKLVTGDTKDKDIKVGDNKIIWAVSDTPDFSGRHAKRGGGVLKL